MIRSSHFTLFKYTGFLMSFTICNIIYWVIKSNGSYVGVSGNKEKNSQLTISTKLTQKGMETFGRIFQKAGEGAKVARFVRVIFTNKRSFQEGERNSECQERTERLKNSLRC